MPEVRILMERVRLSCPELLESVERSARKLTRLLSQAELRTPPTVSSHQLVEEARKLAQGLLVLAVEARSSCGG